MEERRKLQRFALALASSVEVLDTTQETAKDGDGCLTRDVSSGGAYFPTPQPLSTGTRVKVNMLLRQEKGSQEPGFAEIRTSGYVVRAEPTGMAVRFDGRCRIVGTGGP
jgi:PilZ domain